MPKKLVHICNIFIQFFYCKSFLYVRTYTNNLASVYTILYRTAGLSLDIGWTGLLGLASKAGWDGRGLIAGVDGIYATL